MIDPFRDCHNEQEELEVALRLALEKAAVAAQRLTYMGLTVRIYGWTAPHTRSSVRADGNLGVTVSDGDGPERKL